MTSLRKLPKTDIHICRECSWYLA